MFSNEELNTLYRYAFSLANNEDDAYDLLQSCLEKYIARNEKVGSPLAYLKVMIRNAYFDKYRRDNVLQLVVDDEYKDPEDELRSLEDLLVNQEEVENLLNCLSVDEREILFLWAVNGFSIQEIADLQCVPKGTLTSKIFRLRERVKCQFHVNERSDQNEGAK